MTDTKKLKLLLMEKDITLEKLSKLTGLSSTTLSYKINNKVEFKSSEIKKMQKVLGLSDKQRDKIFFAN